MGCPGVDRRPYKPAREWSTSTFESWRSLSIRAPAIGLLCGRSVPSPLEDQDAQDAYRKRKNEYSDAHGVSVKRTGPDSTSVSAVRRRHFNVVREFGRRRDKNPRIRPLPWRLTQLVTALRDWDRRRPSWKAKGRRACRSANWRSPHSATKSSIPPHCRRRRYQGPTHYGWNP